MTRKPVSAARLRRVRVVLVVRTRSPPSALSEPVQLCQARSGVINRERCGPPGVQRKRCGMAVRASRPMRAGR
jgi:hypothetical protein